MVNMDTLNLVGNVIITLQYENGDTLFFLTFLSIYFFYSYGLMQMIGTSKLFQIFT